MMFPMTLREWYFSMIQSIFQSSPQRWGGLGWEIKVSSLYLCCLKFWAEREMMSHYLREYQLVPFIAKLISISGDCALWYLQTSDIYSTGHPFRVFVRFMLKKMGFGLLPSHENVSPLLNMLFMPKADLTEWSGWGQVTSRRGGVEEKE